MAWSTSTEGDWQGYERLQIGPPRCGAGGRAGKLRTNAIALGPDGCDIEPG